MAAGVRVTLNPKFDLRFTAALLAGLSLRRRVAFSLDSSVPLHIVRVESGGERFLVDLSDHADRYDESGWQWCDLYLKRSMQTVREKVVPFGLNYSGRGHRSALRAAWMRTDMGRTLDFLRRPHWRSYERRPEQPAENIVLFQTRLWEPHECVDDEPINAQRIDTVAALQDAFRSQFRGGLVDTPLARKVAPKLIATQTRQRDYISWQRSCKVGVYTRGLFGSIGFKMVEYLASSKCIVSEPLTGLLPAPLEEGRHLRVFHDRQECIALCREMLHASTEMPRQNWTYYERHVRLAADAVNLILRD